MRAETVLLVMSLGCITPSQAAPTPPADRLLSPDAADPPAAPAAPGSAPPPRPTPAPVKPQPDAGSAQVKPMPKAFVPSSRQRWRTALNGYVGAVTANNQAPLYSAQVPFASYLNAMHKRIHAIFAEAFLEWLDSLPASDPRNEQGLVTRLEIILGRDGRVGRLGVVRSSGVVDFDIAALDSVDRAQPFGPPPEVIRSQDGNTYLHWEFHRDEVYACSVMGSRPYILQEPSDAH